MRNKRIDTKQPNETVANSLLSFFFISLLRLAHTHRTIFFLRVKFSLVFFFSLRVSIFEKFCCFAAAAAHTKMLIPCQTTRTKNEKNKLREKLKIKRRTKRFSKFYYLIWLFGVLRLDIASSIFDRNRQTTQKFDTFFFRMRKCSCVSRAKAKIGPKIGSHSPIALDCNCKLGFRFSEFFYCSNIWFCVKIQIRHSL